MRNLSQQQKEIPTPIFKIPPVQDNEIRFSLFLKELEIKIHDSVTILDFMIPPRACENNRYSCGVRFRFN